MTIDGPTGPGGPGMKPPGVPEISPREEVAPVEEPSSVNAAPDVAQVERSGEIGQSEEPSPADLDALLQKAARLVPPEERESFIAMVKEMSLTDPVLQSLIRRLGVENNETS